jgi:hypothetical protein
MKFSKNFRRAILRLYQVLILMSSGLMHGALLRGKTETRDAKMEHGLCPNL